ncbi:diacylglycerol kinase family lipid kinase [Paenibacillus sp. N1-5-1-14]|uniref:diacylglycerol/lipid kinase family protein n=1 Tax=Paenibacillus radicibacter TaxID=2972488 RepID=UPI002158FA87|nr:diacylglycerol kinase family protein [Paenibacillus radicibacter]MCR8644066.1 diacylglycerol kinase family lipid kinase [Paenibacillus radicibacter]
MLGLVVNPVSGHGKGRYVWDTVRQELNRQNILFCYKITQCAGETTLLTQELLTQDEIDTLVVIGGDGTVHEAVNGLYQSQRLTTTRFGFIPAGTGNDFAKGHHIPTDPRKALKLLLDVHVPTPIDLLESDGNISVNCIGAGFDAVVARNTNEAIHKKAFNRLSLGKISYLLSAAKAFFTFRPFTATVQVDEESHHFSTVWMIVSSNIPYFGGGMKINPLAICDDGQADVIVIHSLNRMKLVSIFISIYSGKHMEHPAVSIFKGSHIQIHTQEPHFVQSDGEISTAQSLNIRILPQALQFLKPITI